VIGADTVVLTHAQPVSSDVAYSELPATNQELLEKPVNKADNLRMLQDLNGSVCEVVTGVSLGERHPDPIRAQRGVSRVTC
jgi:septum formation protein